MKSKRILLTLGSLATIAGPIATVVSCGTTTDSTIDSMIAVENFKNGTTPTIYVPTDNTKWYDFLVNDRVFSAENHGVTLTGLWSGNTNGAYQYGTYVDSISDSFGYLQNGKLLMTAYYHKHASELEESDIRKNIVRIGNQLQLTLDNLKASSDHDEFELNLKSSNKDEIIKAVDAITLDNILDSNPQDLVQYDYLGFKTLASIFATDKYSEAKSGSNEDNDKLEVMKFINTWFSNFTFDLWTEFKKHTVAENEILSYAWEEVLGYSWDFKDGALGDRKNASQTLVKPYLERPTPPDHFDLIGNWRVNSKSGSKRDITYPIPSANGSNSYSNEVWRFDGTKFSGIHASLSEANNEALAKGIIVVDEGNPRYGADGSIVSGEASTRHLEFGLFESVALTPKTGDEVVFDSDEDSEVNDKSINGNKFKEILDGGVKSYSFTIKDDVYWTNSNGDKTTHKVTAEDFWYGIQRTTYSEVGTKNSIAAAGGEQLPAENKEDGSRNSNVKALEDYFGNSIQTNKGVFAKPSKTEQASLPFYRGSFKSTYGMDVIDDSDETKAKVVNGQILTLKANDNKAEGQFSNIFWHDFFEVPGLMNLKAAPSEKIKSQVNDYANLGIDGLSVTADTPIIKYGVYYGNIAKSIGDFEFAGRFIPITNSTNNVVYRKNHNYADKDWVDNTKTIETFTTTYLDQAGDYPQTIKVGYESNDYSYVSLSDKNFSSWRTEIGLKSDEDKINYGVTYVKAETSLGDVGERSYSLAIPFDTKSPTNGRYYFNDNFAKILYGDTIKNLWDADSVEPMIENLFYGKGLAFKSALQTAANGFGIIHDTSDGAQQSNSRFGPEALIPGSDSSSNIKTVYDSKIFNRASFGKNFVEVTDAEYREGAINSGNAAFILDGDKFDKLQENIKIALDDAGIKEGEQVISELPLNYIGGLNSIEYATYLSHVQWAFNKMDSRIKFVANVNPISPLK